MQHFEEQENYLVANFEFEDFSTAVDFFNQVATVCEEHNHHPDMGIYDYRFINITSTTHSAGSTVTDKDRRLAQAIEDLYQV